jgi:hypothetical protein
MSNAETYYFTIIDQNLQVSNSILQISQPTIFTSLSSVISPSPIHIFPVAGVSFG